MATTIAMLLVPAHDSDAAGAAVNVSFNVGSATTLDTAGCASDTAGITGFGTVVPDTRYVTSSDCVVDFGSTNDSSQLRVTQADGAGRATYKPATGALDLTFDGDGRNFQGGHNAYELDAVGDGDWVSVGEENSAGWEFSIVRWNGDGTIQWHVSPEQVGCGDCMAFAVDNLADGDIVAAGHYWGADSDLAVMRLDGAGNLDLGYDGDGYSRLLRAGDQRSYDVIEQPGVGIVAAGVSDEGGDDAAVLVRYTDAGVLDPTFGVGGIRVLQLTAGPDVIFEVLRQDDGKLLVAGEADGDLFVARLTSDGALDTTFGASGTRVVTTGSVTQWMQEKVGLGIDPRNGDVIASIEYSQGAASELLVARMDADGTMVGSFGSAGVLRDDIVPGSWEDPDGLFVEDDGRIVVPYIRQADETDGWLVRYLPNGARDTTFGANGILEVAPNMTDDQYGLSVASDPDGRLVAISGGTITRMRSDTIPDLVAGSQDWDQGSGMFGACLRALTGGTADGTTWMVDGDGDCTAVDTDPWNPVTGAGSKVARRTTPGTATARLRFGVRAPGATTKGAYVAPVRFTVLAPDP